MFNGGSDPEICLIGSIVFGNLVFKFKVLGLVVGNLILYIGGIDSLLCLIGSCVIILLNFKFKL